MHVVWTGAMLDFSFLWVWAYIEEKKEGLFRPCTSPTGSKIFLTKDSWTTQMFRFVFRSAYS